MRHACVAGPYPGDCAVRYRYGKGWPLPTLFDSAWSIQDSAGRLREGDGAMGGRTCREVALGEVDACDARQ